MNRVAKFILGLLILFAGIGAAVIAFKNKPEVDKATDEKKIPVVKWLRAKPAPFQMELPSQGLVKARKRTVVAADVGGRIDSVSPRFKAGGVFEKDDVLISLDSSDYLAAEAQAQASLDDAILSRDTEKAKSEQALRDWKRLGRTGEPSALTMRVPHLKSAESRVKAAEASLAKAKNDLERTKVKAPFQGRIETIHTEEGAYLAPGSPVAEIYTTEPYEVRLPLSLDDWTLLERDEKGNPVGEVKFHVQAGGEKHVWKGAIDRTEGVVERESRSLYLVAGFGDAETDQSNPVEFLVQPGLFVKARVNGKTLDSVVQVPVESFRNLDEVMVVEVDEDSPERGKLRFQKVKVLKRSVDGVLVSEGIEDGQILSRTELADMIEGMEVVLEETADEAKGLAGEASPKP